MHFQPLFDQTRFEIHYNLERQYPAITGDMKKLTDLYHDQFHKAWSKQSSRDAFIRGFLTGFSSLLNVFNGHAKLREEMTERRHNISSVIARSYANCERLAIRRLIDERGLDERALFPTKKHRKWMELESFPEWDKHYNVVHRMIIGKPRLAA